jgi:hypothetical protein
MNYQVVAYGWKFCASTCSFEGVKLIGRFDGMGILFSFLAELVSIFPGDFVQTKSLSNF